jgi:uncharacterized membrane protein
VRGRTLVLGWQAWVALGLALAYFVGFTTLSLLRYYGYHTRSFDLAIFARTLWGVRHLQWAEVFTAQPWLDHFEPIVLPLAFVDAILPSPEWLLVLQTAAVALAALPAWRLAERKLGRGLVGVVAVLAYPVVGNANLFEAHPVTLAIAPGLWLLDALDGDGGWPAWAAGILVASCREDGLLFVAAAIVATRLTRRRLLVAGAALAAYAVYALVVMPRLGTLVSPRRFFGWLGATPGAVLEHALRDPGAVLAHFWERRGYLLGLLAPLAFLPLLAPRRALAALPVVALNLLSSVPDSIRIVDCHYSALAAPGLVFAAICGAARLGAWTREWIGVGALAAASVAGTLAWGAAPLCGGYQAGLYTIDDRAVALDAMVARMPADARVSVPADVVAHVAERQDVNLFPSGVPDVDFALADLASRAVRGLTLEQLHERLRLEVERARAGGMRIIDQRGPLILLGR